MEESLLRKRLTRLTIIPKEYTPLDSQYIWKDVIRLLNAKKYGEADRHIKQIRDEFSKDVVGLSSTTNNSNIDDNDDNDTNNDNNNKYVYVKFIHFYSFTF